MGLIIIDNPSSFRAYSARKHPYAFKILVDGKIDKSGIYDNIEELLDLYNKEKKRNSKITLMTSKRGGSHYKWKTINI